MGDRRKEIEVWGVNYERYAVGKLLQRLKREYNIRTVAEMPAQGTKAMPSIYSLGFGVAGAKVLLINGCPEYKKEWEKVGIGDRVKFVTVDDIYNTHIKDNSFDFVWNFAYIPTEKHPERLINEMKRISRKYVALFSVNGGNVGFYVHSALHKINKIPWTHGDKHFNYRNYTANVMKSCGLNITKKGYVDTPVWPDSLGFRDMRLHKNNIQFDNVDWVSPYVDMLAKNEYPNWIKWVYAWESIPMIPIIKTIYSHIFYVIGEKNNEEK